MSLLVLASSAAVLPQYISRFSTLDVPLMRIWNSADCGASCVALFQNASLNARRFPLWSVNRMSFPLFMASLKSKFVSFNRTNTTVDSAMGFIQSEIVESSGMVRACAHCSRCSFSRVGFASVWISLFSPAKIVMEASPIVAFSSGKMARIWYVAGGSESSENSPSLLVFTILSVP